jgi:hypothetical protein
MARINDKRVMMALRLHKGSGGSGNVIAQSKTVTPTKSKQTVLPDANYTHLSRVTVNAIPDKYIEPSGTKNITANSTVDVTNYQYAKVNVPIPDGYIMPIGEKELTANGTYDVTGYARVNVAVENGETKRYLHTITFVLREDEYGGEETLTMTLVNNSPASLSRNLEEVDSDIYNGAIIEGYESNGAVVGHYSNGGGGACYIKLEDGTRVDTFYGQYTDNVTEYKGTSEGDDVIAQAKTVTPTKTQQIVLPDANYTHLSQVTVKPIPSEYIVPSGDLEVNITADGTYTYDVTGKSRVVIRVSGREEKQYLHTITFTSENEGEQTLTMTLVNNSSASLSGEYELEDTDIYNGAIIEGYESNGAVVGHYSNGGGGNCYLELEDGTQVNSFYGSYYDTVTEYNDTSKQRGIVSVSIREV